jgi:hypothetical protein
MQPNEKLGLSARKRTNGMQIPDFVKQIATVSHSKKLNSFERMESNQTRF